MRKYFVSYFYNKKKSKVQGWAHCEYHYPGLIRGHSDLEGISRDLCKQYAFKWVIIMNWRRFEEPHALISERSGS